MMHTLLFLSPPPPPPHLSLSTESNRHVLVEAGAITAFVKLLESNDEDVQFYSAAALSNLAVHGNLVTFCILLRYFWLPTPPLPSPLFLPPSSRVLQENDSHCRQWESPAQLDQTHAARKRKGEFLL